MVARNLVCIDGYLGAPGLEAWSIGLHYGNSTQTLVSTGAGLQTWAEDIADYLSAVSLPGLENMLSSSAAATQVRTYYYPGSGPAQFGGSSAILPIMLGSGTAGKPPQSSAVFTHLTGLAGRRYRGRTYWPWLATSFTGSTLKGSVPSTAAAEFAAMVNAIGSEAATGDALEFSVYSRTADVVTPVTQVRVGDVVDTQRRRRDNLVELYQVADL
jgi:hypothetical protein